MKRCQEMENEIKNQQQGMEKRAEKSQEEDSSKKGTMEEGVPAVDSPYLSYKDLEDYKRKGYGTEGQLQPKPGRGAGATDAPTPSGGSASAEADVSANETVNRQRVP